MHPVDGDDDARQMGTTLRGSFRREAPPIEPVARRAAQRRRRRFWRDAGAGAVVVVLILTTAGVVAASRDTGSSVSTVGDTSGDEAPESTAPATIVVPSSHPPGPPDDRVTVIVLNGAGVSGLASDLSDELAVAGYSTFPAGDHDGFAERSEVFHADGSAGAAAQLAAQLCIAVAPDPAIANAHSRGTKAMSSLAAADLAVVLGTDWPDRPDDACGPLEPAG